MGIPLSRLHLHNEQTIQYFQDDVSAVPAEPSL